MINIFFSDEYKNHDTGNHPESIKRIEVVNNLIKEYYSNSNLIEPSTADKKLISLWFLLSRIFRNFVKPNNVITKSKKSMNKPLLGSLANAWTETNTPDLTKKVPSKLKINVNIAKNIVHLKKRVFLLANNIVWSRVEAVSHGSNEAFSTGSQNQNPPHPNS